MHALQDLFTITPLSVRDGGQAPATPGAPRPDPRVREDLQWWERFRVALTAFPPPQADAGFVEVAASFGVTAAESPYVNPRSPAMTSSPCSLMWWDEHDPPASTLTDNGSVYPSRFTGGRNAFEYVLPLLGVRQKNGPPGHPQTQGKTERFHQTLQRWLRARAPASSIDELQRQLDALREHYNEHRPHRVLDRTTPAAAYRATPKAVPATNGHAQGHHRLRYDRLDNKGKMTLRRAGRMHHLGVGTAHARKRVLALADDRQITVADLSTGEVLSIHLIEPNKTYWRNKNIQPGRWPDSSK